MKYLKFISLIEEKENLNKLFSDNINDIKDAIINHDNINQKDKYGWTPLIHAINYDNNEIIKFLIKNGADIKLSDNDGNDPIYYAIKRGNLNIIKLLIENGVELNNLYDDKGLMYYAINLISINRDDIIKLLLKYNININNDNINYLYYFVKENNYSMIKLFIDKGIKLDKLYELIIISNNKEIINLLIDYIDIENTGDLLKKMIYFGDENIINKLVNKGIKITKNDYEYAMSISNLDIINILKKSKHKNFEMNDTKYYDDLNKKHKTDSISNQIKDIKDYDLYLFTYNLLKYNLIENGTITNYDLKKKIKKLDKDIIESFNRLYNIEIIKKFISKYNTISIDNIKKFDKESYDNIHNNNLIETGSLINGENIDFSISTWKSDIQIIFNYERNYIYQMNFKENVIDNLLKNHKNRYFLNNYNKENGHHPIKKDSLTIAWIRFNILENEQPEMQKLDIELKYPCIWIDEIQLGLKGKINNDDINKMIQNNYSKDYMDDNEIKVGNDKYLNDIELGGYHQYLLLNFIKMVRTKFEITNIYLPTVEGAIKYYNRGDNMKTSKKIITLYKYLPKSFGFKKITSNYQLLEKKQS